MTEWFFRPHPRNEVEKALKNGETMKWKVRQGYQDRSRSETSISR
ncbi:hypothetical protein VCR31J2_1300116 [Vibrio coralliirubri]|uniref:Uncharacterized protein n=1 Tax=Vibrio coralliirubri TaxID=1516159 RepID=A0AA87C043_9VIBR|nr:hypothetical protein VCR29J2_320001 [Vibrio coralliirubri]CDT74120.1 hypothetical protein VCR31J2_1300116 [Vibrio coralliirubri]